MGYRWFVDINNLLGAKRSSLLYAVIRSGLLSGKLSQTTQTLHITRSTARSFERDEWAALEKRILAWKTGLAGVLEVVANARRQSGNPHNSLQAHATTVAA